MSGNITQDIYDRLFTGVRDYEQPYTFEELIAKMEDEMNRRDLSEETTVEPRYWASMGEYIYGVTLVPIRWVLPIIEDYYKLINEGK